jgi:hypothetical protein
MDSRMFAQPGAQPGQQTKISVSLDCWIVKKINDERIACFNGTFLPCTSKEDFERTVKEINARKEDIAQSGKKKDRIFIYANSNDDPYSVEVELQITLNGKLNGKDLDKGFSSIDLYYQFLIDNDLINAKQIKLRY